MVEVRVFPDQLAGDSGARESPDRCDGYEPLEGEVCRSMKATKNVLFILIDCLRADMCFGEDRFVKTPTIDSLKEKGTSFTQAIAVAARTEATVASMLTGVYPFMHGFTLTPDAPRAIGTLNRTCVTLQEVLQKNGYHTYAMVTGPLVTPLGLNRGFGEYSHRHVRRTIYSDWGRQLEGTLKASSLPEPWFLFLHLWELHMPRIVLRSFDSRQYGRNRYERALSCLDQRLKGLIDSLDLDRTVVFLHGDHGENYNYPPLSLKPFLTKPGRVIDGRLGIVRRLHKLRRRLWSPTPKADSRWIPHGGYLYEFLVRVPLIAVGIGLLPESTIINEQVSQVDILPTILDAVGLRDRLHQRIHGRSLMPLVRGESLPERPVFFQTRTRVGVRTPRWKLIINSDDSTSLELYDLENDPTENTNLREAEEGTVRMLEAKLEEIQSERFPELVAAPGEPTEEERKIIEGTLRDLGYL